mgnify:CR=1 FL=1
MKLTHSSRNAQMIGFTGERGLGRWTVTDDVKLVLAEGIGSVKRSFSQLSKSAFSKSVTGVSVVSCEATSFKILIWNTRCTKVRLCVNLPVGTVRTNRILHKWLARFGKRKRGVPPRPRSPVTSSL